MENVVKSKQAKTHMPSHSARIEDPGPQIDRFKTKADLNVQPESMSRAKEDSSTYSCSPELSTASGRDIVRYQSCSVHVVSVGMCVILTAEHSLLLLCKF